MAKSAAPAPGTLLRPLSSSDRSARLQVQAFLLRAPFLVPAQARSALHLPPDTVWQELHTNLLCIRLESQPFREYFHLFLHASKNRRDARDFVLLVRMRDEDLCLTSGSPGLPELQLTVRSLMRVDHPTVLSRM